MLISGGASMKIHRVSSVQLRGDVNVAVVRIASINHHHHRWMKIQPLNVNIFVIFARKFTEKLHIWRLIYVGMQVNDHFDAIGYSVAKRSQDPMNYNDT